jgi:DNA invertase Pin-like site-specific DNA recombinase
MLLGYARVSTQDQNLDLRRQALTKAGCQKVFEDQISCMLREGDTLVVWKLGWLGRSVKQLVNLVGELPHAKNG